MNANKRKFTPHNILVSGTPDPNLPSGNYVSPFPKEKKELDKEHKENKNE